MQRHSESASCEDVLHKTWLWHGTSVTDPMVWCMGQDGIDFRRVRRVLHASHSSWLVVYRHRVRFHIPRRASHGLTMACR